MEKIVKNRLQSLQFAEAQIYKNIAILPLIAPADGILQYRTLGEALADRDITITEVSAAGSVPDLLVVNRAQKSVLLVDGEELAGAKQNRVLNTSILLKEASETKIPVSCTEQGRWSYVSNAFSASGHVMDYRSRSHKSSSVHSSLEASAGHKSDQAEVWEHIAHLHHKSGTPSPTSAMSDVYKAREQDLRKCDETFKCLPNQVGLFAFIGGAPAGADLVSLMPAYAKLHSKLVRSYALEALLDYTAAPQKGKPQGEAAQDSTLRTHYRALARAFLDELDTAEERQFPSVGYGVDFRYRSSTPHPSASSSVCGTALVHENEVIHAAFFSLDGPEQAGHMASYRSRRRHYVE